MATNQADCVECEEGPANYNGVGPHMMNFAVPDYPGHRRAEAAMFVTPFESMFQGQRDGNPDRVKQRAQQNVNNCRMRPDPLAEADMFHHHHNLGHDQSTDEGQRQPAELNLIFAR